MPLWNSKDKLPVYLPEAQKRNVVATPAGWSRKIEYTDAQGKTRTKEEIMVAIGGLSDADHAGAPNIIDAWFVKTESATGTEVSFKVKFDEEIMHSGDSADLTLVVTDTANTSHTYTATSTEVTGKRDKLTFKFTPDLAGTYKVESQTIGATGANVVSFNTGNEAASLVIDDITSNTAGTLTVTDA